MLYRPKSRQPGNWKPFTKGSISAKIVVAVRNRQKVKTVESIPIVMDADTGNEPAIISEKTIIQIWLCIVDGETEGIAFDLFISYVVFFGSNTEITSNEHLYTWLSYKNTSHLSCMYIENIAICLEGVKLWYMRLSKPTRNLWYHTIQHQNSCISRLVLSCQNHKSKHLNFNYIYRICYKNAKKANPMKWICPFEKTISQVLNRLLGLQINCRTHKFQIEDFTSKSSFYLKTCRYVYKYTLNR